MRATCCFTHVLQIAIDDGTALERNAFSPEEVALPVACSNVE